MNFQQFANSRVSKFGRGGLIIRPRTAEGLSIEEIQTQVPSVFADEKHSSRSKMYTFISTRHMLEGMIKEGFVVSEVRQGGSKDVDKRGFTKHAIRFRHRGQVGPSGQYYSHGVSQFGADARRGDSFHEIGIINSHDGSSAYQAFSAWFRIACLNGLITFDSSREHQSIKVPHKGDILNKVIEASYQVINQGKEEARQIEHFRGIPLNLDERIAFARAAAELRWEDGATPVKAQALVVPNREDDRQANLWATFNIVQENLVKGGLPFVREQEVRNNEGDVIGRRQVHTTTRPINGIDGDVKLNRALWRLQQEMAALKG